MPINVVRNKNTIVLGKKQENYLQKIHFTLHNTDTEQTVNA